MAATEDIHAERGYGRVEDVDGIEKEIETFKGDAEVSGKRVHAVGGADSLGVVYMAAEYSVYRSSGDGRQSIESALEI